MLLLRREREPSNESLSQCGSNCRSVTRDSEISRFKLETEKRSAGEKQHRKELWGNVNCKTRVKDEDGISAFYACLDMRKSEIILSSTMLLFSVL